ncbi:MAG: hypothetical protein H6820_10795 [Phycisphaerales bacterium]|nr:hypothetical protein [Phycisphaerales bacterium]
MLSTTAIVVAVLGSAVNNSKSHRLRDMELSRLRDLAAALQTYAVEDPDNILGPVHPAALNFVGEGYSDFGGGPGSSSFLNWGDEFDPATRPLNRLLYGFNTFTLPTIQRTEPGDRSVYKEFQCLGNDLGFQNGIPPFALESNLTPHFKSDGTSFRVNNLTINTSSVLNGYGIYARPTNRIPAPSETLALMEARAYQTIFSSENSIFFGGVNKNLAGYHDKLAHFMLAYADGHASFENMRSDTFYVSPSPATVWIRGTWGRMDCSEDPIALP